MQARNDRADEREESERSEVATNAASGPADSPSKRQWSPSAADRLVEQAKTAFTGSYEERRLHQCA